MAMHYARRLAYAAGIQDLMAEYAHVLDSGRFEAWPDFFTPDCRYRVTTAENHRAGLPIGLIDCDSRGMLIDRVQSLRQANIYEAHSYRHVLAPPRVTAEHLGEVVDAHTGFIVTRTMRDGSTSLFVTGEYIDRFKFVNDTSPPLIQSRIVVCDSSHIDTLLVLPL